MPLTRDPSISAPFLANKMVCFHPITPDHADIYWRWQNDHDVRLYFGNSVPVTRQAIDQMFLISPMETIHFEICIDEPPGCLKPIGLFKISGIHWIRRKCSLGALIGEKSFRGRGYGKAATQLAIEYVFGELNLHKITTIIYQPNIASQKVVEQLGFQLEARIGDAGYFNGEYCEDLYYTYYQHDWRAQNKGRNHI